MNAEHMKSSNELDPQDVVTAVERMREKNPLNRMAKSFPNEYYLNQSPANQKRINRIIASGLENNDSEIGAYAMNAQDYKDFKPVLAPIIEDYHAINGNFRFKGDWNVDGLSLDLKDIDPSLAAVSMRVRVARNVDKWPLTGSMTKKDRIGFESYMVDRVFSKLMSSPQYGGRYVSLTPGSPYHINDAEYKQLVSEHKMFKDMSADHHLESAGISSDWPYGRGMYMSKDGGSIVWVNEEDHLRIMNMKQGSNLKDIFTGLKQELELIGKLGVPFAQSATYGYVTSCPSNLGTGMRASLHLALPKLTEGGTNVAKLKTVLSAQGLNVSVRGAGGEHTAAGEGGVVDISPRGRMIRESQVITELYAASAKLISLERG